MGVLTTLVVFDNVVCFPRVAVCSFPFSSSAECPRRFCSVFQRETRRPVVHLGCPSFLEGVAAYRGCLTASRSTFVPTSSPVVSPFLERHVLIAAIAVQRGRTRRRWDPRSHAVWQHPYVRRRRADRKAFSFLLRVSGLPLRRRWRRTGARGAQALTRCRRHAMSAVVFLFVVHRPALRDCVPTSTGEAHSHHGGCTSQTSRVRLYLPNVLRRHPHGVAAYVRACIRVSVCSHSCNAGTSLI